MYLFLGDQHHSYICTVLEKLLATQDVELFKMEGKERGKKREMITPEIEMSQWHAARHLDIFTNSSGVIIIRKYILGALHSNAILL